MSLSDHFSFTKSIKMAKYEVKIKSIKKSHFYLFINLFDTITHLIKQKAEYSLFIKNNKY